MVNIVSDSDNPFAFGFQWPVAVDGYEVQAEPKSTSQHLQDGPFILRRGTEMNVYPPRACPGLHREFIKLDDSRESVLKFVRKYGFLGINSRDDPRGIEWESVSAILAVRDHMRSALDAFNELRREESWMKRRGSELGPNGEGLHSASPEQVAEVAGYSRQFAGELFNRWAQAHFVLRLRAAKHGLALHAEPLNLLGFMWLQVAEEITGGAQFSHCEWCHKPISIGKGGARADKKTCSGACRHAMNAHLRKIRAEAESKKTKKSKQAKRGSK